MKHLNFYSIENLMDIYDVPRGTVNRWIEKRYLDCELLNNEIVFTRQSVEAFDLVGIAKGYQVVK